MARRIFCHVLRIVTASLLCINFASGFVKHNIDPKLPSFASGLTPKEGTGSNNGIQDASEHRSATVLFATTSEKDEKKNVKECLDPQQLDFILGYLNKHHSDMLSEFVVAFSSVGVEMAKANAFSGGSFVIESAEIVNIDTIQLELKVQVKKRGNVKEEERRITVELDASPIRERERYYEKRDVVSHLTRTNPELTPIDVIVRKLCRLAWIVKKSSVTGKLIQLGIQLGGAGVGQLPENMFLNQVPHNRFVRQWFYDQASKAVKDAVIMCSQGKISNRMKIVSKFPETNPMMDSYRIGTILEMIRDITIALAEENLRVRVCVQGTMGVGIFTGIPKQLTGVSRLLQAMDWQSNEGEINEGMVGEYVRFGEIGRQHVMNTVVQKNENGEQVITQHGDDIFIIIAPQSMVGMESSIMPSLQEMTEAAGDRPVILFNPDLADKISAAGQQSVRGRQQRIDFANSFQTIFHFQNIYVSGTSYFPILGVTTKLHPTEQWIAHQRRDFADGGEIYVPVLADESLPDGESIIQVFER